MPSGSSRGPQMASIDRCLIGRRIIPSSSGRIRVALALTGGLSIVWICWRLLFLVSTMFYLAVRAGEKSEEEEGEKEEGWMAGAGGGQGTALCRGREPPAAPHSPWPLWAQPQLDAGAAPCLQEPQGTGEEQSYCRSSEPTAPPRWEQTPDPPHPPALDPVLCSPGSSRAPLVPVGLSRGSQHHQTPLSAQPAARIRTQPPSI